MGKKAEGPTFDKEFYDRFYRHPSTAVVKPEEFKRLASFVLGYLDYLNIPVRNVVDFGCGLGLWQAALEGLGRQVTYTGVEASTYLCDTYGWKHASVVDFKSRNKYDLIICQDVLPYLTDREVRLAIKNIARLCRGAVYLQAITSEDWEQENCDRRRTDPAMRRREAGWYRKLFSRHFVNCGGGVFVPKDGDAVLWELERG